MTGYQEELSQMQHDLETGLDNMAEAIANQATDAEGNLYFRSVIKLFMSSTELFDAWTYF